jgi:membrane dipeptidase
MIGFVMNMNRRDFFRIMPLGALLSGEYLLGPSPMWGMEAGLFLGRTERGEALGQERTSQLYRDALVIDALVTTRGWSEESWQIATQAGYTGLGTSLSTGSMEAALGDLEEWNQRIESSPDKYVRADSVGDFEHAHAAGKLAVLLGFQNTTMIGDSIQNLDDLYQAGTRWIQLTYNERNLIGDGCTERTNAGLSDFGIEVVERMNDLGVMVDLSHCGRQTTLDAILFSDPGPCFTHTVCEALYPSHPRSKTDEEIRAMAEKGGVMGVVALGFLVGPDPGGETTIETFVDHIDHVVQIASIDHVGVASDFVVEGISGSATRENWYEPRLTSFKPSYQVRWPPWIPRLDSPDRYKSVAEILDQRGYRSGDIEKVLGLNWMRYYRQVFKAPGG